MHITYRLDKFPTTTSTLSTRKEINALLQDFEEKAMLPYRLTGDSRHIPKIDSLTKLAKEKAEAEAEKERREENRRRLLEEERERRYQEKKKNEKILRRKQYEDYLKGAKSI